MTNEEIKRELELHILRIAVQELRKNLNCFPKSLEWELLMEVHNSKNPQQLSLNLRQCRTLQEITWLLLPSK